MNQLTRFTFCLLALIPLFAFAGETEKHNFIPKEGYVPNAATAIKIAVAIWEPIYGVEKIAEEKPYQASLVGDVWIVQGSLPKGWLGGVAVAEISKSDGKVLRVSHGR